MTDQKGKVTADDANAAVKFIRQFGSAIEVAKVIERCGNLAQQEGELESGIKTLQDEEAKAKESLSSVRKQVDEGKAALKSIKEAESAAANADAEFEKKQKERKVIEQREIDAHEILMKGKRVELSEAEGSIAAAKFKAQGIEARANAVMDEANEQKRQAVGINSKLELKTRELAALEKKIEDAKKQAKSVIEGIGRGL